MSDSIADRLDTALAAYTKSDFVEELFKKEIIKFFETDQWHDMLYNHMLDVIWDEDFSLKLVEEEIKKHILPKIQAAFE